MWNSIAKLIKQCCFLTDGTLVGDKWYIGSESRDRVAAPWNGSLQHIVHQLCGLWAERPHPFWGVFMGDIAGVHWRTINRVRCDYCIPSNRLHNSVLMRALILPRMIFNNNKFLGRVHIKRFHLNSLGIHITKIRSSYLYNGNPFIWKDNLYIEMQPSSQTDGPVQP